MLISLVTCSVAFAADPISYSMNGTTVTVTVEDLNSSEETTLLVVPKDTTIDQAFANTALVHYINQTTADDDGVATFKFTAAEDASYDIYSGYATMGVDDDPYKTVIDKSQQGGGDTPSTKPYILGDVNNDTDIDAIDASAIIDHFLSNATFKDATTREVYQYGKQAADVNGDTDIDAIDASAVIDFFLSGKKISADNLHQIIHMEVK